MPADNVVWEPIPRSSQELALDARADHVLYAGTRGPGKTDTQLMAFRKNVSKGYGPFWRGVIFDKQYKNLDDLVSKSKRWFPKFNDGAKWYSSAKDYKWAWPTGEELLFRQFAVEDDYNQYHGHEYPFVGFNELVKYATSVCYDAIVSCNRSSYIPPVGSGIPEIPLMMFSTTNPFGAGHIWVKQRWIDPVPYGKVRKDIRRVFNPRTQREEDIAIRYVALFGTYRENIYLSPQYVASLDAITDENKRKAWLYGSWDIVAGGALSDVWRKATHVIPRFKRIPKGWYVDRAMDWGSYRPFSVGWFAEANGEEAILADGTTFCPPPGTIVQFWEWYGSNVIGSNEGIKLPSSKVADGIKAIEQSMVDAGLIASKPFPGPADNQIRAVNDRDQMTIEDTFKSHDVYWTLSDKSPGSRVIGLELLRERLENATDGTEYPGLYVTQNCVATISTVPILPRDVKKLDDVDTECEDHAYDMVRYRALASKLKRLTHLNGTMYGHGV